MADSPARVSEVSVTTMRRQAGWSAILLGGLGVHKFLLGYRRAGAIRLGVSLVGWIFFALPTLVMMLIGVIEGLVYLRKSDADFAAAYLKGKRAWF